MTRKHMYATLLACALTLGACGHSSPSGSADQGKTGDAARDAKGVPTRCSDPAHEAFAALSESGVDSSVIGSTVNAQELAFCAAEALGKVEGWRETTTHDGQAVSSSRVNTHPLKLHQVLAEPADSKDSSPSSDSRSTKPSFSEVIMVGAFVFAKVDNRWIEVTKDNPDPQVAALLQMRTGFEAQLNAQLRAAGTDSTLLYTVKGSDTLLGQPVLVLRSEIADPSSDQQTQTYVDYYVNKDYVILRSDSVVTNASGTHHHSSELTSLGDAEEIANPILSAKR